jgi:hypothetical protein
MYNALHAMIEKGFMGNVFNQMNRRTTTCADDIHTIAMYANTSLATKR